MGKVAGCCGEGGEGMTPRTGDRSGIGAEPAGFRQDRGVAGVWDGDPWPAFLIMNLPRCFLLACVLGAGLVDTSGATPLPAGLLSEFDKAWPANRAIQLVFHGHSVPAGYHRTPDVRPFESYPHLVFAELKRRHPRAVINVIVTAIGGENSVQGAARFGRDVLCHRPDVVFIDYALNDRGLPEAEVATAWRSMIREAKERKVPVVLLTPTGDSGAKLGDPADPLERCAAMIRKLAGDEGVWLADVLAAWEAEIARGTPLAGLLSQANHPNLRGHRIAADAMLALFGDAPGQGAPGTPRE